MFSGIRHKENLLKGQNLPIMVFIDFKICLPTKKKIKPNGPPKQSKSIVYTIKIAHSLCSSNIESKNLHFKVFESESTLFEPKIFIPENQDPIFASHGYKLQVILIYICLG